MKFTYDSITGVERVHWQYEEMDRPNAIIPAAASAPSRFVFENGVWINPSSAQTGFAKLVLAGDLMCQERLIEAKRINGENEDYDFDSSFAYVKQLLKESDLAIGNLESVIHPEAPYSTEQLYIGRYYSRNAPPQFLDALKTAGFDVLVASNNHMVDTGTKGLFRTYGYMTQFGFIHTGSFIDDNEPRFALINVNGIFVGILSYTMCMNFRTAELLTSEREWMLNRYEAATAKNEIARLRKAGAEYVICYMHWGTEMVQTVNASQQRVAQELADYGVDYIAGSHPHVVQPYVVIAAKDGRRVPVIYSMGNLISHFPKPEPKTSIAIELDLHRLPSGRIAAQDHYVACYTFSEFDGAKYVTIPLANRVFKTQSVNDNMRKRRQSVARVLGGLIFPSHSFDIVSSRTEALAENCSLRDVVLAGACIVPDITEIQARVLNAYRITNAFRNEYCDYMRQSHPDGEAIKTAICAAKRFLGDENLSVEKDWALLGEMIYAKYVLGFSYREFFAYGLSGKPPEECAEFISESVAMKYSDKLNKDRQSIQLLYDKFRSYQFFKGHYKREIIKVSGESDRSSFIDFCSRHSRFIVEPVVTHDDSGMRFVDLADGFDLPSLFNQLLVFYLLNEKTEFICEEPVVPVQSYAKNHCSLMDCLRVFTYHDGVEPKVIVAWLESGLGQAVIGSDSPSSILAAIDCESGIIQTVARDRFGQAYERHPDGGYAFKGFKIEAWEEAVRTVCEMAHRIPGACLVGWHVMFSADKGWQVMKGDASGAISDYQIATQKGMLRQFLHDIG